MGKHDATADRTTRARNTGSGEQTVSPAENGKVGNRGARRPPNNDVDKNSRDTAAENTRPEVFNSPYSGRRGS